MWNFRLGLQEQLAAGFIAVGVLTFVAGAVSLLALHQSIDTTNIVVAADRTSEMSMHSNIAMLKARRAEKDFLIFQQEFGFEEARSRYATLVRTNVADIRRDMADLRQSSDDPEVRQLTQAVEASVKRYEAGFLDIVGRYGLLGHADTGLEGQFQEKAHTIEEIVSAQHNDRLMAGLLSLRRHEKDFILRGTDKYVTAFAQRIVQFKADLARAALTPGVRATLLGLTADYQRLFDEYARVLIRIEVDKADYLAAAHAVEPLLIRLQNDAEIKDDAAVKEMERDTLRALWAIYAIEILAATLGLALALGISRRITDSVNRAQDRLNEANALLQQEVQQHQIATERAEHLACYDGLTGLANRSMFSKLMVHAISLARRDGRRLAVLFIDLDRFKQINDTLGHDAGDLLLQEVAQRLQSCLRESDTVARLGGDEFVVLLPALQDTTDVAAVAHKILAATSKSFVLHGQECLVTASVGISIYPKDGDDEHSLMKNADIAMYRAKEAGKNNFQFYSSQMTAHSFDRLELEAALRRALEHNEFQLHYQPKIDAHSDRIVGIEALLRWQHPELGRIAPAKFIPIAEETGLIVGIGKWVLRTACAQNVAWQHSGLPHLPIAVNVSRRQFADEGLLRDITAILAETGLRAGCLELEIAESTLMHDVNAAMRTLQAFRELGVRLAIVGFGAGYSSLTHLREFPADTIKIDGSFIRNLGDRVGNKGITEAVIAMGRTLSMTVIAEGVETRAQADLLREQACDELQGFYFSQPVPADKFAQLLEAQTAAAGKG